MAERYTRLFALPADLYTEGAPLLVTAGALLKDTVTGKVLAQFKFTSLCEKTIKAVKVRVTPFDTVGRPLGEAVYFTYLDLVVTRDNDFGQKTPIPLAESEARSFAVTVEEVAFANNSLWASPTGALWEPLPAPQAVGAVLQNDELAKQYVLKFGQNHTLWPQRTKDLWRCSCGALNRTTEKNCHQCSWTIEDLDVDIEALKAEAAARLEQERIAAEKTAEKARLAKEKAEAEARRAAEQAAIAAAAAQKARKKKITIFTVAAVVVAAAAAAWFFVLQPMQVYRQAMVDVESGDYDAAITALESRPDTDEKAQTYLAYAKAAKALADGAIGTADTELDKFADYEPLQEQYAQMTAVYDQILLENEQKYQAAYAILTSQANDADYSSAKQVFEELGDYKDAKACAEDAENLIDLAEYLGTYLETEDTCTIYTASGTVAFQNTTTAEDVDFLPCIMYYSFNKHCLMFKQCLEEVPTADELLQWDDGDELIVDGNRFSYHLSNGDMLGKLSGDGFYLTQHPDPVDDSNTSIVAEWTFQRIS